MVRRRLNAFSTVNAEKTLTLNLNNVDGAPLTQTQASHTNSPTPTSLFPPSHVLSKHSHHSQQSPPTITTTHPMATSTGIPGTGSLQSLHTPLSPSPVGGDNASFHRKSSSLEGEVIPGLVGSEGTGGTGALVDQGGTGMERSYSLELGALSPAGHKACVDLCFPGTLALQMNEKGVVSAAPVEHCHCPCTKSHNDSDARSSNSDDNLHGQSSESIDGNKIKNNSGLAEPQVPWAGLSDVFRNEEDALSAWQKLSGAEQFLGELSQRNEELKLANQGGAQGLCYSSQTAFLKKIEIHPDFCFSGLCDCAEIPLLSEVAYALVRTTEGKACKELVGVEGMWYEGPVMVPPESGVGSNAIARGSTCTTAVGKTGSLGSVQLPQQQAAPSATATIASLPYQLPKRSFLCIVMENHTKSVNWFKNELLADLHPLLLSGTSFSRTFWNPALTDSAQSSPRGSGTGVIPRSGTNPGLASSRRSFDEMRSKSASLSPEPSEQKYFGATRSREELLELTSETVGTSLRAGHGGTEASAMRTSIEDLTAVAAAQKASATTEFQLEFGPKVVSNFLNGLGHSPLPEQVLIVLAYDILSALQTLHDKMFMMHNDIKLDNILISREREGFVLCDFGCALPVNRCGRAIKDYVETLSFGNSHYRAPEAFLTFAQSIRSPTTRAYSDLLPGVVSPVATGTGTSATTPNGNSSNSGEQKTKVSGAFPHSSFTPSECTNASDEGEAIFSIASDIWALGLCLLELRKGRDVSRVRVTPGGEVQKLPDDDYWQETDKGSVNQREFGFGTVDIADVSDIGSLCGVSGDFKAFLRESLRIDHTTRPAARELLKHSCFAEVETYRNKLQKFFATLREEKKKASKKKKPDLGKTTPGPQGKWRAGSFLSSPVPINSPSTF